MSGNRIFLCLLVCNHFSCPVTVFLASDDLRVAEALFRFIDRTIDTELSSELAFLVSYDETKRAIQEIVDMPARKIDLFIRFCLGNNGRLSVRKRASHFDFLLDEEIARMEQAVQSAYGDGGKSSNNE